MGSRAGHTKFGRGAGALGQWLISAVGDGSGVCSDCGKRSSHRHGWHERHLQDLPAQGAGVTMKLRIQRWQCRNKGCNRQTCAAQLPEIAAPPARRTVRAAELVHLIGHGLGGRPGERLLERIGLPTSDDTRARNRSAFRLCHDTKVLAGLWPRDLPDFERLEDESLLQRPQFEADLDGALGLSGDEGQVLAADLVFDDTELQDMADDV